MTQAFAPVEAEPADVALDLLHEVDPLLRRVRIVEAQVARGSGVVTRDAEVQADRLGVPDVQVAVWLGRKPRHDASPHSSRRDVGVDRLADEVGGRLALHRPRRRTGALRLSHPLLHVRCAIAWYRYRRSRDTNCWWVDFEWVYFAALCAAPAFIGRETRRRDEHSPRCLQDRERMKRKISIGAAMTGIALALATPVHAAGDAAKGKVKSITCMGCHGDPRLPQRLSQLPGAAGRRTIPRVHRRRAQGVQVRTA